MERLNNLLMILQTDGSQGHAASICPLLPAAEKGKVHRPCPAGVCRTADHYSTKQNGIRPQEEYKQRAVGLSRVIVA